MFHQVIDNLGKATDITLQMQQEMLHTWAGPYPGGPPGAPWAEILADLIKKRCELLQVQFGAGLQSVEEVFLLTLARNPEELRARAIGFWQETCARIRQVYAAQVRAFQDVVARGTGRLMPNTTRLEGPAAGSVPAPRQPSPTPRLARGELEEVREALYEHELTKGDWSKAR
jgi:hypothetical protein